MGPALGSSVCGRNLCRAIGCGCWCHNALICLHRVSGASLVAPRAAWRRDARNPHGRQCSCASDRAPCWKSHKGAIERRRAARFPGAFILCPQLVSAINVSKGGVAMSTENQAPATASGTPGCPAMSRTKPCSTTRSRAPAASGSSLTKPQESWSIDPPRTPCGNSCGPVAPSRSGAWIGSDGPYATSSIPSRTSRVAGWPS